jgi:hypothetical protein
MKVRFVPTGDAAANLFNDRVGQGENLRWQIEAERLRSFKIDYEFKLRYSNHWQISGLFAL